MLEVVEDQEEVLQDKVLVDQVEEEQEGIV
jgi:hypothetical protein